MKTFLTRVSVVFPNDRSLKKHFLMAAVLVLCSATANAQSTGLTQITAVANAFVTWLRGLGLIVGLGGIVWGGIHLAVSQDFGRGFPKILGGICGLIIAGYAQEIVNMFYTTTS